MRFINWAPSNETLCSAAESESEMKANKLDSSSSREGGDGARLLLDFEHAGLLLSPARKLVS